MVGWFASLEHRTIFSFLFNVSHLLKSIQSTSALDQVTHVKALAMWAEFIVRHARLPMPDKGRVFKLNSSAQ
jgi:hypothetical protein